MMAALISAGMLLTAFFVDGAAAQVGNAEIQDRFACVRHLAQIDGGFSATVLSKASRSRATSSRNTFSVIT